MDVTVTESQLRLVLDRLGMVRLELLRLRALCFYPKKRRAKKRKRSLKRLGKR